MKGRSQSSEIKNDSPQVVFTCRELYDTTQHSEIMMFQSNPRIGSNKPLVQNGVERTRLHYSRENGK